MEFSIFLSVFFYFTNRNFKLCLLPPTPCSDQSCISEFLLSAVENLKLEKETCFITFQAPRTCFLSCCLFPYRYKERKKSTSSHRIVGNLYSASYYLYNVRAWFITFLKQNKNAILRNWRQYAEKLINMCFIHFLHCLLIRGVSLQK